MQNHDVELKAGRVLVADRHQNMLEGIGRMLETVFDVVVMVADENSLLDSIETIQPDLVIVDLSLPITEQINVARSVKRLNPDVKLIILSVHDEPAVVDDCLSAGAAGFVLKRSAINDLIPGVRKVLKGRTYVSPTVEMER